jgi:Fe-S cluster biogenesis protein NfuA
MTAANEKLFDRIEEALKQIRPFLEADGGNVSLVDVTDDNIAKVKLHGSCISCNMSHMTMKAGVEEAIKRSVPEIVAVEAVNLQPQANI